VITPQNEIEVGAHVRRLREQQKLSLRAMSERCGLSINAISQIERGEVSPSIATLGKLAFALRLPITDFFAEDAQRNTVFVKHGQGLLLKKNGFSMEHLGNGRNDQPFETYRMVVEPGLAIPQTIAHPGYEFVYCMDGQLEYSVGSRVYLMEVGDCLKFAASQPHAWRNSSAVPATILLIFHAAEDHQLAHQRHLQG